ncbi:hypothetical protein [Phaeobacter gallaeciensis]|nr:hypothetical protein [Phaeobacter gallaeciensis]
MAFAMFDTEIPTSVTWLDPADARAKLKDTLRRFLQENSDAPSVTDDIPVLGLKVSAGLGKTRAALEAVAELGADYLKIGHILFYVPTHALAEEAAQEFQCHSGGDVLPSLVLRGRNAINPETGTQMCQRWELADKLSGKVDSITKVICRTKTADGKINEAACASGCPYLAQREISQNHVIFLPHSYLALPLPIKGAIALRIVDEKFWSTLTSTEEIDLRDWKKSISLDSSSSAAQQAHAKASDKVRQMVNACLTNNTPLHEELRNAGFAEKELQALADTERTFWTDPEIQPTMGIDEISAKIDTDKMSLNVAARRNAKVFALLAETAGRQSNTERLCMTQKDKADAITAYILQPPPQDSPYILLDADLDESITRNFFPQAEIVALRSRPLAEITQVSDLTLSDTWLTANEDTAKSKERCKKVLSILDYEVARARREQDGDVLLVATTKVLRALYEAAGVPNGGCDDPEDLPPLRGADVRWFGPRMLGLNRFKSHATIVVVGRQQPPVSAIEAYLRAMFGDGDKALQFAKEAKLIRGKVIDAQGSTRHAQVHPDEHARVLLAQSREAGAEQAIARLRLIDPSGPKRVLILSNLPLPNLPIDRSIPFNQLVEFPGLTEPMPNLSRLKRAITQPNGTLRRGIRTSPKGLHEDAPHEFRTRNAAKDYAKKFAAGQMIRGLRHLAEVHKLDATEVTLAHVGGRRRISAVVFVEPSQAGRLAGELWPDYRVIYTSVPACEADALIEDACLPSP